MAGIYHLLTTFADYLQKRQHQVWFSQFLQIADNSSDHYK